MTKAGRTLGGWLALGAMFPYAHAIAQDKAAPAFHAGSRLVQADVVVRSGRGPAEDLTKADFTILDGGKPREIAVFAVVSANRPDPNAKPLPPGAVSNRVNADGRAPTSATVLLVDRINTGVTDQVYSNKKVLDFIKSRKSGNRLGIYVLGAGIRVIQDLTEDPDRLRDAAARARAANAGRISDDLGLTPTGNADVDEAAGKFQAALQDYVRTDRVESTKEALIAIAHHLANVPGRKNLVWVSAAFPLFVVRPHETIDYSPQMREAAQALNDANIAVYPVDARGLIGSGLTAEAKFVSPLITASEITGHDTMNTLASWTGGKAFYNTNGIDESIRSAEQDAELTYTLGFYLPEAEFDGKYHKLSVKVDRKGVDVRARKGYYAFKAPDAVVDLPKGPRPDFARLWRDPLDSTTIEMVAQALPDPKTPGEYTVRIRVSPSDVHLEHVDGHWKGVLDFALLQVGERIPTTFSVNVDLPDKDLSAALVLGIPVNATAANRKAVEGLRVIVQDRSTGASGSVTMRLRD